MSVQYNHMNNTEEGTPIVGGGGSNGKNIEMKRLPLFVTLLLVLLPISGGALFVITDEFKNHTEIVVSNQEMLMHIASTLVKEKLDHAVDVGVSLAGKTMCRQSIEKGEWDEALKHIETVSKKFPFIDAVNIFDSKGILKAMNSRDINKSILGKDFSYRDYIQGVSRKWEPYVSEVFTKATEPKFNVVAVALPIFAESEKILGILVVNIKLDVFNEWVKGVDAGPSEFIYVVDQNGHIVAHHEAATEEGVIDYSLAPAVQKILRGESGVEVLSDPMESGKQLVAYAPVPLYGWGVAVLNPENIAFQERTEEVVRLSVIFALGIFGIIFFLYRILSDRKILKAQRDHEATLLESIGDGVVAIDRNWNITLWNKAASDITGWSKDEAMRKPFRTIVRLLRERDRVEDTSFIEDAMVRGKVTSMGNNTLLVRRNGSEIHVGDSAAPIFCEGETPDGVIIVFRDMTVAIEKSHLRSDFSYASHQLRTPITEALWNLETGIEEQDADKKNEDLRVAHQSLLSIKKLSEHLVSVSEIDQGNVAVKLSEVKLIDTLTEIQGKLEKEANMRGITMSIAPVSPLIAITTDKKLLAKTLFEVIENAVIYSRRDGTVIVTTTQKDKEFLFEVTDTGVGIPDEEQVLIFTKFFRASNRGSENPGDGLGLYLVKAYINLIGGKIWFESVEGEGTTFCISLPIE